ncbi:MAG: hypothetical protein ACK4V8_07370 [Moraxella osloensis]
MLNRNPVSKPTFFNLTILAATLTYTLSVSACSTAQTIAAKTMPSKTTSTVANTPINAHPTANAVTDTNQLLTAIGQQRAMNIRWLMA